MEKKQPGKCIKCNKRNGVITYANSVMDWTHGMSEFLCRQCYIKKLEGQLIIIQKSLKEQKRLLEKEKDGQKRPKKINHRDR